MWCKSKLAGNDKMKGAGHRVKNCKDYVTRTGGFPDSGCVTSASCTKADSMEKSIVNKLIQNIKCNTSFSLI